MKGLRLIFTILCVALFASACSIQKMAMESVIEYTKDEAIPYLMSQEDIASAAAMGEALAPLMGSMTRLKINPDEVSVASQMAAGMAAEATAREEELRKLRAIHRNVSTEAQDALIAEKLAHALAGKRFYAAYESAMRSYPNLDSTCYAFKSDTDAMLALLGLASGALALIHDFNAEKAVGISLDVPVGIEKAMQCFDDETWWGVPTAIRASIWLSIPGSGPEGVDPLLAMKDAATLGNAKGVFLAHALWIMMAKSMGADAMLCEALDSFPEASHANPDWALLSTYARKLAQHQADMLWTQKEGHRAAMGTLQCPYEASPAVADEDWADLLDGLDDDEDILDALEDSDVSTTEALPLEQVPAPESQGL